MSEEKFTKGPWRWELNKKDKVVELCGREIEVLRFARYGMQGAAPTFTKTTFKLQGAKVEELAVDIDGREHHSDWCQTINHPDAHLIAKAPKMYEELKRLMYDIQCAIIAEGYYFDQGDIDRIEQLLAEARGEK